MGAPYAARGQSLLATGQYQKAVEDFNATLNVDNRQADGWAGRGLAFERLGDTKQAIENYERAAALDSSNKVASEGLSRLRSGVFR